MVVDSGTVVVDSGIVVPVVPTVVVVSGATYGMVSTAVGVETPPPTPKALFVTCSSATFPEVVTYGAVHNTVAPIESVVFGAPQLNSPPSSI